MDESQELEKKVAVLEVQVQRQQKYNRMISFMLLLLFCIVIANQIKYIGNLNQLLQNDLLIVEQFKQLHENSLLIYERFAFVIEEIRHWQ